MLHLYLYCAVQQVQQVMWDRLHLDKVTDVLSTADTSLR